MRLNVSRLYNLQDATGREKATEETVTKTFPVKIASQHLQNLAYFGCS
jgi:hypothetical protein